MDLSQLTTSQFLLLLLVVSAIDFVTGVAAAIRAGEFSWSKVAIVLDDHVLKRVTPIMVPAFVAFGTPAGTVHDGLWAGALVALALYVAETVASATGNASTAIKGK